MGQPTLGVEEEYQLIDTDTGVLRPVNELVLDAAQALLGETVHPELLRSQVEVSTPVCATLAEVDGELRRLRRRLNTAAARYHCRLGAAGTHPTAEWHTQEVTPSERYLNMAAEFQQMARDTVIFGCHVHVGIDDPDERIRVMNRIRGRLPVLLALSANSPYWGGVDTGFASYRTIVFRRWPTTGMPSYFSSDDDYQRALKTLVAAGVVEDATHLYWDVRPSGRFPTLESRIADVCLTVDEAVTVTGLVAALVATAESAPATGTGAGDDPADFPRPELLNAAVWRAARHGLDEQLIDVAVPALRPAGEVVDALLRDLRPALEDSGTWERVRDGVAAIRGLGNGATRQRGVFRRHGSLPAVIDYIAEQTAAGT